MKLSRVATGRRSPPSYLSNLDSSTTFVRATASYLRGEEFPGLGIAPRALRPLVPALNRLPGWIRERLYARSGASEAVPPGNLESVRAEEIRSWVVDQYPRRGYPAVLVGSPNGAAVHLAALLGIPWLPQTFLIPVRRTVRPDAATADLEWGRAPGRALLEANPDLTLHHMHDPNQDRLMVERLAYFRVKSRRLGAAYEQFLETVLEPGGTVILLECDRRWPTTRVGDRHVFQFGGLGGISPGEYFDGSDRVDAFLARRGASRSRWDPPEPDGERPEAEWGFEPALREDVARLADERGYGVRRLVFDNPRDLSPVVADLYRTQYAERGIPADRLLAESFVLVEPWWTLRTGSVPYWLTFNTEPDARALERYLDGVSEPYDDIRLMLVSHGIESAGFAPVERWRSVLERARTRCGLVGVDPEKYPLDLGTYVRYRDDLAERVHARHPLPPPLSLDRVDAFLQSSSRQYPIRWIDC